MTEDEQKRAESMGCAWLMGIIIALSALSSAISAAGDLIYPEDASMRTCVESCGHDRCATFEPPHSCHCAPCEAPR
jgi:hypothetical protein